MLSMVSISLRSLFGGTGLEGFGSFLTKHFLLERYNISFKEDNHRFNLNMLALTVVILDVSPYVGIPTEAYLHHVILYLRTTLSRGESLRVAALCGSACRWLPLGTGTPTGFLQDLSSFVKGSQAVAGGPLVVARALSMALCVINKVREEATNQVTARVEFVLSQEALIERQCRSAFLNAAYCAMSGQVRVSSVFWGVHRVGGLGTSSASIEVYHQDVFEQAARLTGGCTTACAVEVLSQALFFPSCDCTKPVSYKQECVCHRKLVDLAFVCPQCLSAWCSDSQGCPLCEQNRTG